MAGRVLPSNQSETGEYHSRYDHLDASQSKKIL